MRSSVTTGKATSAGSSPPPWWEEGGGSAGWGTATFPMNPAGFADSHSFSGSGYGFRVTSGGRHTQRSPLQVQLDMTGMVLHGCVAVVAHLSEKEARRDAVDGDVGMGSPASTDGNDYGGVAWRHYAPDMWQTILHCLMPDAPKPPTTLARVWARGFLRHPTLVKVADSRFSLLGFDAGDDTEPVPGTDVLVIHPTATDLENMRSAWVTRRLPAPPFAHVLIADAVEALLEPAESCSNTELKSILGDHGGMGRDDGVRWPALLAQMPRAYHDTALAVGRRMARALRHRYDIEVERPLPPVITSADGGDSQPSSELPKAVRWQIAELFAKATKAQQAAEHAPSDPSATPALERTNTPLRLFGCPEDIDAALAYMIRGRHPAVVSRDLLEGHPHGAIIMQHLQLA